MIKNEVKAQQVPTAQQRTAQVRVRKRNIVEGHPAGTIFWLTAEQAHFYNAMGVIDIVGGPLVGPTENKGRDESKKSCATRSSGRLTDSAGSSQRGQAKRSSASAEGLALHPIRSGEFEKQENGNGFALSLSTILTRLRLLQTFSTSQTVDGGNGTRNDPTSRRSQG